MKKRIFQRAFCILMLPCALLAQNVPTEVTFATPEDLRAAFEQAYRKKDIDALSQMFCWDGVSARQKRAVLNGLRYETAHAAVAVEIVERDLQKLREERVLNGVRTGPNLPVVKGLSCTWEEPSKGKVAVSPIGLKNGRYLLANYRPIK